MAPLACHRLCVLDNSKAKTVAYLMCVPDSKEARVYFLPHQQYDAALFNFYFFNKEDYFVLIFVK
jgi:hypothetical protein